MTEMQEAMAAVDGKVASGEMTLAPEKVGAGITVVGIELSRSADKAGKYMESITKGWNPVGKAIALRDGHVVASNYLFGRWANGAPKISACHKVACKSCGKTIVMPMAVWEAKDRSRNAGVKENLDEMSGFEILRRHGSCSCGGKWDECPEVEKRELTEFADRVLRSISEHDDPVPPLLLPRAFTVHGSDSAEDLGKDWTWLQNVMVANGKSAVPFEKNGHGDVLLFNPGYWIGTVANADETGLFFPESANERASRMRTAFNPAGVDGL